MQRDADDWAAKGASIRRASTGFEGAGGPSKKHPRRRGGSSHKESSKSRPAFPPIDEDGGAPLDGWAALNRPRSMEDLTIEEEDEREEELQPPKKAKDYGSKSSRSSGSSGSSKSKSSRKSRPATTVASAASERSSSRSEGSSSRTQIVDQNAWSWSVERQNWFYTDPQTGKTVWHASNFL